MSSYDPELDAVPMPVPAVQPRAEHRLSARTLFMGGVVGATTLALAFTARSCDSIIQGLKTHISPIQIEQDNINNLLDNIQSIDTAMLLKAHGSSNVREEAKTSIGIPVANKLVEALSARGAEAKRNGWIKLGVDEAAMSWHVQGDNSRLGAHLVVDVNTDGLVGDLANPDYKRELNRLSLTGHQALGARIVGVFAGDAGAYQRAARVTRMADQAFASSCGPTLLRYLPVRIQAHEQNKLRVAAKLFADTPAHISPGHLRAELRQPKANLAAREESELLADLAQEKPEVHFYRKANDIHDRTEPVPVGVANLTMPRPYNLTRSQIAEDNGLKPGQVTIGQGCVSTPLAVRQQIKLSLSDSTGSATR